MIINNIIDKFLAVAHILKVTTPRPTRKGQGEGLLLLLLPLLILSSCSIKDDLPLPIRKAQITAFDIEGQCDESGEGYAAATIDKEKNTIDVYVDDRVDITRLHIKRLEANFDAKISVEDSKAYFPESSFYAVGDACPVLDCSHEITFVLTTYQTYRWTLRVHQVIKREVNMSGQVGEAIIDPVNFNVIVYVVSNQKLSNIRVQKFSLGGIHGTVTPDPTQFNVYDFSTMRTFQVKMAGLSDEQTWRVFVYNTDNAESVEATAFAHSVSAIISGTIPMGTTPIVEYHEQGTNEWTTANFSQTSVTSTHFTSEIAGLRPGTTYIYRVTSGTAETMEQTFTTVAEQHLVNSSFDRWSSVTATSSGKDLWQPWGEGDTPYWSTGNAGTTTVGNSNSTYKDEDGRRFANLQSKYIVVKFAAGNIFTGDYLETDGTNGVLSFGRPFTSFPTKMRFDYKYKSSPITRTGGAWKETYGTYISKTMYENFKGKPDSCSVYIALGDWEPVTYTTSKGINIQCPYLIRTRPSALHLFDMNDPHLIAFAQMTKGEDVKTWTTETLTLDYRVRDRQPKYIIVVASSSKYGDYFTGGEESLLQIDNIELLYE